MGAWGRNPFENDDALDWLAEADDSRTAVAAACDVAVNADYVDSDAGFVAVAAAVVVAAALDGDRSALPEGAARLAATLEVDEALRAQALAALDAVLGESSELASLWSEGPEGAAWRQETDGLRARIASAPIA